MDHAVPSRCLANKQSNLDWSPRIATETRLVLSLFPETLLGSVLESNSIPCLITLFEKEIVPLVALSNGTRS